MRRLIFTSWDKSYNRKGQIGKIINADVTARHNTLGSCEFTVAARNNRVADLSADGGRVTVDYYPDDGFDPLRFYSGMITNVHGEGRSEQATRTFTVTDDWNLMNTTLAFPNPTGTDAEQGAASAYYTVLNKNAETLVKQVVDINANTRLGMGLVIEPDLARGDVIPKMTFRMHPFADRMFPKVDQAGIGVRIIQVDDHRELQVYAPTTYPRVLTEDSKIIQGGSFDLSPATMTRVLVGAGGEGTARVFKHYLSTVDLGTVLEQFQDARDIPPTISSDDDPPVVSPNPDLAADMQARADETLAEAGPKESMDLTLVERGSFRFGQTFNLGDRISVQMTNGPVITDLVRSVQITQSEGAPLLVTPQVGNWSDSANARLHRQIAQMAKALRDMKRR